jgi:hypothetical protein
MKSKALEARVAQEGGRGRGEFGGMRIENARVWRKRNRAVRVFVMWCLVVAMARGWGWGQGSELPKNSGQESGKEIPDAPEESKKKEQGGNPALQAAEITKNAATAGLIRARNWESTWITGVYVARDQPLITPTGRERREIYLRQTLTTPGAYLKRAFGAGIDQASGTPRQWDDGVGGYMERFASREGQFITANTLAALGNAKLGYEVRYDKCKCDGLWPRTRHALLRNLMTYDRSEEHLRPQWALYGGAFGGGAVSVAWKAGSPNAFSEGARAMGGQLAWGTLLNFVTEFSREINRKQGVK